MASSSADRDPVEKLAQDFIEQWRSGQSPSISDYAVQHPEWAERIQSLFPMLMLLEEMRGASDATHAGPPGSPPIAPGEMPQCLGDYRIVREIGRGGMGVVYEAEQESLGRRVALKVLPANWLSSPMRLRRFLREARAAARLHHTNIVPIFGIGHQNDVYYYVMQYIPGQGLDRVFGQSTMNPTTVWARPAPEEVLTTAGPLSFARDDAPTEPVAGAATPEPAPPPKSKAAGSAEAPVTTGPYYWRTVANIGRQVAEALEYAHQHGVLHRDIKPSNLLLDHQGTVWVSDFGLAKLNDTDDFTQSEDMVGTLRYMAPEQFAGRADARSDVYSLGLTLYELLVLRPAFDERDRRSLIRQVTQEEPPPLGHLNPAVPRDLETIVTKAIDVHPDHRYRTAGELAADLRCFLDDRPIHARRISPLGRLWRWCRRNRAVAALTGTAAVLLLTVAMVASVGYLRTTEALQRVSLAREQAESARLQAESQRARAQSEHDRAEANLRLAINAFEEIFNRIGADPVTRIPDQYDDGSLAPAGAEVSFTDKDAALLETMLTFYDQFSQRNDTDVRLRKETATAYRRVGDIHRRLGQYAKAETAYRHAMTLYRACIAGAAGNSASLTDLAAIDNDLGLLFRRTSRSLEARDAHQHALETLRKQSPQQAATAESRYELARTFSYLTFTYPNQGGDRTRGSPTSFPRNSEAVENNRRAREILDELIRQSPDNPLYRLTMARCQRDRGMLASFAGRADEATQAKREAVALLEDLVHDAPHDPDYRFELAETYAFLGRRSRDEPVSAEARSQLQQGLVIAQELATRYPSVPEYRSLLARLHSRLADALRPDNSFAAAAEHLQTAIKLHKGLIAEFPTVPSYQFTLVWTLRQLADLDLAQGNKAAARTHVDEALKAAETIPKDAGNAASRNLMAGMQYRSLARLLRELGDDARAAQLEAQAGPVPPDAPSWFTAPPAPRKPAPAAK